MRFQLLIGDAGPLPSLQGNDPLIGWHGSATPSDLRKAVNAQGNLQGGYGLGWFLDDHARPGFAVGFPAAGFLGYAKPLP